jgi:hypothetical protein
MFKRVPGLLLVVLVVLFALAAPGMAQEKAIKGNEREILEQILKQTYQPSVIGKHMMGIGAESGVQHAGTIVIVQRAGLYGSLLRSEIASSSIHGTQAELFRGHKDYEVPVGERFYVVNISVGQETIFFGLLSTRVIPTHAGTDRVWTVATFYFSPEVLASADKSAVMQEIDRWFLPEGRYGANPAVVAPGSPAPGDAMAPATYAAAPGVPPPVVVSPAAVSSAALSPGMSREQIIHQLGPPLREVSFEARTWLTYPVFVVILKDGKLASLENPGASTARLTVRSEPSGAEIYVDGKFSGSTPSALQVAEGNRLLSVRSPGFQNWDRDMQLTAGSDINVEAKLAKN